jgi:hypothetical protein
MLFADDLILIATLEDYLQITIIYKLNTVATKYNMEVSAEKTRF